MSETSSVAASGELRILVVEDEALVAMAMEDMLADLGCIVVDVAGTLAQALSRIDAMTPADLDGAILDVNLGGDRVYPAADALARLGVPFIFATGYGPAVLEQRYPRVPVLSKPVMTMALAAALATFRPAD